MLGETKQEARALLQEELKQATLIFKTKKFYFYRYQDKVMPCTKKDKNTYIVRTLLYWHMLPKKLLSIRKIPDYASFNQNI